MPAEKYQVPFLIHTEASSHLLLTPVCREYPRGRFLWAQADEGWEHYDALVKFHRSWMEQLPAEVEVKIRLHNAELFLTGTSSGGN